MVAAQDNLSSQSVPPRSSVGGARSLKTLRNFRVSRTESPTVVAAKDNLSLRSLLPRSFVGGPRSLRAFLRDRDSRIESPKRRTAHGIGFRRMAAQEYGFARTPCCIKGKIPISKRSRGGAVCKHHSKKRCLRSKEQLLPGIPDDITLNVIVPRLSWSDLHLLSSVSRRWEEAIETHEVYKARVRANSTETLIMHIHVRERRRPIALYSTSKKCCYRLPQIPWLPKGIFACCECIALGGKIYVLGGCRQISRGDPLLEGEIDRDQLHMDGKFSRGEVYMLDLAGGQWEWEQCASMLSSKFDFCCGIMGMKIYEFGESLLDSKDFTSSPQAEVYDTQKDAWSPIMPMTRSLVDCGAVEAAPVGKELFLYSAGCSTLEVYNPAKDAWRTVDRFWVERPGSRVFITRGKFYSFSQAGIDIYNDKENLWVNRHTNSFATVRPDGFAELQPISIIAVADELVLTAGWNTGRSWNSQSFQCKGFEGEEKEIVWQTVTCSHVAAASRRVLQRSIEL